MSLAGTLHSRMMTRWWVVALMCWAAVPAHGQAVVGLEAKQRDLEFLDSLLRRRMDGMVASIEGLQARDALLALLLEPEPTDRLDWGLALHGWVRSAGDAHLRVRFDGQGLTPCSGPVPSSAALLDVNGPWSGYGPGLGLPSTARLAWLRRTWSWIGPLGGCPELKSDAHDIGDKAGSADIQADFESGMRVRVMEGHVEWAIRSFGEGSEQAFRKALRKQWRQVRRSGLPVLLDLSGNLGGFRSRRHAVLSCFLDPMDWPAEMERDWDAAGDAPWEDVPAMPVTALSTDEGVRLAVLVDGLSFSASLLLADALVGADRAALFGCAPLGVPQGCSGSPKPMALPGSGWIVEVPTRETRQDVTGLVEYELDAAWNGPALSVHRAAAVEWLLGGKPRP